MPFKHKSGSRKGQEKKEQEEKAAKLPKLDYFGFLASPSTSSQPTESAVQQFSWDQNRCFCPQWCVSNHATVNNFPAESQTILSSLCTHPSLLKYVRLINYTLFISITNTLD